MAVVPPGGSVLCIGNGPVLLLSAKQAALRGFETYIISGAQTAAYRKLLYAEGDQELPNLKLIESVTGDDEDFFDNMVAKVEGVIVAIDEGGAVSDGLLEVALPESAQNLKRVVGMSRSLNGKGLGPFVSASKFAANKEVWAGGDAAIADYKRFETKLRALAEQRGGDSVICRVGTLKGGGNALGCDERSEETARQGLTEEFYSLGQQDIVNWRLLFDGSTQGVTVSKGDVLEGPGFGAVFAATATDAQKGDSGRLGVAAAMVRALEHDAGNYDFSVGTATSGSPPTDAQWKQMFSRM